MTTLDGFEYTHRTHGRFIMARDEQNQFELEIEFGPCELNERSTCFHRAELTLSHLLIPRKLRIGPGLGHIRVLVYES